MLNPNRTLRVYLLSQPAVTDLVGVNIAYPGLPKGLDCAAGDKALVLTRSGGTTGVETPLSEIRFQMRAWARTAPEANAIYAALFDVLHGVSRIDLGNDGFIVCAYEEMPPQDLTDPDSGWETVLGYFRVMVRQYVADIGPGAPIPIVTYGAGFTLHLPLEDVDGIRMSFTFPGLPDDMGRVILAVNGLVECREDDYTRVGDVLTFTSAPDDLCVYF